MNGNGMELIIHICSLNVSLLVVFDCVEWKFLKGREKDAKMCIITDEKRWSLFMLCPTLCF
jgi:hypothetical protein